MLILARHAGEKIIIGEPPNLIVVEVVDIGGDTVRLGVTADREKFSVHRLEVYERIHGVKGGESRVESREPEAGVPASI